MGREMDPRNDDLPNSGLPNNDPPNGELSRNELSHNERSDAMDGATDCAWGMFLDTLISGLGAVADGETLALVAPPDSNGWSSQLVIRADRERGWMWVTRGVLGSTAADEVVARVHEGGAFELADAIVRVAREDLRLPHPQLLTAWASGPGAAQLADRLRLGMAVPGPDGRLGSDDQPEVLAYGGPDALRPMAARVIREVFGVEPEVDDDGDLRFHVDDTPAWLVFTANGGIVQAWSMVVRGVYSRRNTAVELDILNNKAAWSTWYMSDRDVFLRNTLPARPLTADNLEGVLRNFALELRSNRKELAYRLGGTAA